MIATAQAVEHFEITRYGTLVAWANLLGYSAASKLLDKTLKEEHAADTKLTKIAENHLNAEPSSKRHRITPLAPGAFMRSGP